MISNFFSNLQDITVFINYLLQLELGHSAETLGRVVLNTTFGIGGAIDVASDIGLPKRLNDYGITFGKWGMEESPYFVIPVMGPSTVRDAVGKGISAATSIAYYLPNDYEIAFTGLYIIDERANLLTAEKIIDTVSDDEYIFVRNSYITYRDSLIRGEKPDIKREKREEELLEDILDDTLDDGSLAD